MKIVILIFLKHSHKLFFPLPMGISVGRIPVRDRGAFSSLVFEGPRQGNVGEIGSGTRGCPRKPMPSLLSLWVCLLSTYLERQRSMINPGPHIIPTKSAFRLGTWKCGHLSTEGKSILVNSSLSNIPMYAMGFYLLLEGVRQKTDTIRARFYWQGLSSKKLNIT